MAEIIEMYRFGEMFIQGRKYRKDVKIVGGRVFPDWWRREGHNVDVEDVEDILNARPAVEVLVVGMGDPGRMQVSRELKTALAEAGIHLVEEPTKAAISTFNEFFKAGKRVAGAFHLTC